MQRRGFLGCNLGPASDAILVKNKPDWDLSSCQGSKRRDVALAIFNLLG